MRKFYIVGLIAVAALVIGIAIADEIKFSTYYPAPFGKYREFDTTGKTCLATDEWGIEGANARVGIGTTDPGTAKLAVIGGNVGIGTTEPQAILDVNSTTSGFLPPRMTQAQLDAIEPTVTEGSVAYNTTDEKLNYRDSTSWQSVGGWQHDGSIVWNAAVPGSWTDLDLSEIVGSNRALVFFKGKLISGGLDSLAFRTKGDSENVGYAVGGATAFGAGASGGQPVTGSIVYLVAETDRAGFVQMKSYAGPRTWTIWLRGYISE